MPKIVIRSNNQNEDVLHTINADTLSDCDLSGLNLPKAAMYAVEIVGELVKHQGPSTLDALTLRSYVRNLPIQFLLGLGYTEEEIEVFYGHFTVPKDLTTRASFLMLAPMMRLLNACAVVCCA